MIELLFAPFGEFEFMRRALVGALALSLSGAPIGGVFSLRGVVLCGAATGPPPPSQSVRKRSCCTRCRGILGFSCRSQR